MTFSLTLSGVELLQLIIAVITPRQNISGDLEPRQETKFVIQFDDAKGP